MNDVNIAGRLLQEPERSQSASGIKIAKLKIAVDKINKDGDNNGYDVFEVVVFRDLADIKVEVGQFLGISGRLMANNYEKEDKSYYNCSIVGNNIALLGK